MFHPLVKGCGLRTGQIHHAISGNLTISMAIFDSFANLPEGIKPGSTWYIGHDHVTTCEVDHQLMN